MMLVCWKNKPIKSKMLPTWWIGKLAMEGRVKQRNLMCELQDTKCTRRGLTHWNMLRSTAHILTPAQACKESHESHKTQLWVTAEFIHDYLLSKWTHFVSVTDREEEFNRQRWNSTSVLCLQTKDRSGPFYWIMSWAAFYFHWVTVLKWLWSLSTVLASPMDFGQITQQRDFK